MEARRVEFNSFGIHASQSFLWSIFRVDINVKQIKISRLPPTSSKTDFNAGSGWLEESPQQLASILSAMQDQQILPEVYSVRPDSQLEDVVHNAIKSGIKLIVVAGGDGTIDSILGAMVGSDATLGIIPTGTRNNIAFNLGITGDIANSVALLRKGRRLKIDVGRVPLWTFTSLVSGSCGAGPPLRSLSPRG